MSENPTDLTAELVRLREAAPAGTWQPSGPLGEFVSDEHHMAICRCNETVYFPGNGGPSRSGGCKSHATARDFIIFAANNAHAIAAEAAKLRERVRELEAEVKRWKPMTDDEITAELDKYKDAPPLSQERIDELVKYATDPANRLDNDQELSLHRAVQQKDARISKLEAESSAMRELLQAVCERQGSGHFQDGFGDDSRHAWVCRIQKLLDASTAGRDLLAERERDKRTIERLRGVIKAFLARFDNNMVNADLLFGDVAKDARDALTESEARDG